MIYWLLQFQTWTQKLKSRGEQGACAPPAFQILRQCATFHITWFFSLKTLKVQNKWKDTRFLQFQKI